MKASTKDKLMPWVFFIAVLIFFALMCDICERPYGPIQSEEDIRLEKEDDYWRQPSP